MQVKTFELRVEITVDHVRLVTPGGTQYPYHKGDLPDVLYGIVKRCLIEDSELSKQLAQQLQPQAEQS